MTNTTNLQEIMNGLIYTVIGGLIIGIINFLATYLYRRVFGANINYFWKERKSPLEKLINHKSEKQIIRRIKILLIDDEYSLNIEQFNQEGYTMDYWPKVKSIKELLQGNYDIIILDIKNVAKEYSEEDGFGVLKTIKQNNPSQIVIAFSAHSYDFSKKKFWDLADEAVDKPVGFLEMKEVLDNIIRTSFYARNELKRLAEKVLSINLTKKQFYDIENKISTKIIQKKQLDIDNELSQINDSLQKMQVKNMLIRFINLYTDYETE